MRILSIIAVIAATATPALAERVADERDSQAKTYTAPQIGKASVTDNQEAKNGKGSQAFLDRRDR